MATKTKTPTYSKPVRFFFGHNSSGTSTEVCQSENGKWYQRWYEWNGYQKSWTKWRETEPTWETAITNAYSGEVTEREEPALSCGFTILPEYKSLPKYRLPL